MPAFHQYWSEKYDWRIFDGDGRSFNMPMPPDYDMKNIHSDIVEAINLYQPYLKPHAFAMEMVREFANRWNETPLIITARRPENVEVTDSWLQHYLGIPYTLVTTGSEVSSSGENKPDTIAKWGVRYFVEDRFKTCNNIKSCDQVFMPDRPWNTHRVPLDHVMRVNNLLGVWDEVTEDNL